TQIATAPRLAPVVTAPRTTARSAAGRGVELGFESAELRYPSPVVLTPIDNGSTGRFSLKLPVINHFTRWRMGRVCDALVPMSPDGLKSYARSMAMLRGGPHALSGLLNRRSDRERMAEKRREGSLNYSRQTVGGTKVLRERLTPSGGSRAARRSNALSPFSVAFDHSGRHAPAARAPAASRAASAGSAITRRRAQARAAESPGGTSSAASSDTVSGIAPAVVAIRGRPCAIASAKTMP